MVLLQMLRMDTRLKMTLYHTIVCCMHLLWHLGTVSPVPIAKGEHSIPIYRIFGYRGMLLSNVHIVHWRLNPVSPVTPSSSTAPLLAMLPRLTS